MSKANILHRLFTGKTLPHQLEYESFDLFDDEYFDDSYIFDNMDYLNTIFHTLKADCPNDTSFKSYLYVLAVITSHLPSSKDNYQTWTTLYTNVNKAVQDLRDENRLKDYEKDRKVDLDRNLILKNLNFEQIWKTN